MPSGEPLGDAMIELACKRIAEVTGATYVAGDASRVVRGCVIDSRKVEPGGLFVAFPGERVDGNRFVVPALEAGAACVAVTADPSRDAVALARERGACILRVADDDGEGFMLRLAAAYRSEHDWLVVGVTGSVGKTTTKDMLACALATRYAVHATAGNYNNLLGVPLTLLSAPADADVLVVEMGMNHAGEIERLSEVVRPQVAIVTNVGTSHIGLLGSREAIARAKGEVVSGMSPSDAVGQRVASRLFLSGEDDFAPFLAERFAEPAGIDVGLVGFAAADAVRASDVTLDDDGLPSFTLSFDDGWSCRATSQVPGRHAVSDYLLAVAAASYLGCDRDRVVGALAAMAPTHMRLEVVSSPSGVRVIDDSYNAIPGSMAAALDVLCSMRCSGRRIAVLGEMGELGSEEARLHGLVGAYAAAKPLDMLAIVGSGPAESMAEAARIMGMSDDRLERFPDVEAAERALVPVLSEGDLVLAKASRAAGLDGFVKGVLSR
jgi:UDP-N-acetylmuramoyl-tripeptide--D-alanyl-D-alanine ligase